MQSCKLCEHVTGLNMLQLSPLFVLISNHSLFLKQTARGVFNSVHKATFVLHIWPPADSWLCSLWVSSVQLGSLPAVCTCWLWFESESTNENINYVCFVLEVISMAFFGSSAVFATCFTPHTFHKWCFLEREARGVALVNVRELRWDHFTSGPGSDFRPDLRPDLEFRLLSMSVGSGA